MSSQASAIVETVEEHLDSWNQFDALFVRYGGIYGVDWRWLKAIALNESSLGRASSVARGLEVPSDVEGSKSSDGLSWGIMQVTLRTAKDFDLSASAEKLNNPEYSIKLASQYLSRAKKQFTPFEDRYLEWVIKSYNQGYGNTSKERLGTGGGFADEYWERFLRNLKRVEENL